MARNCFLHIGPAKTGTSAIQASLRKAAGTLHDRGFHYPGQERNHIFMASAFLEEPGKLQYNLAAGRTDPAAIAAHHAAALQTFEDELAASGCQSVIISSEHLSTLGPDGIARLRDWLAPRFAQIRVICYARSPVLQMPSRLQQTVKIGRQRLEQALKSPPVTRYQALIEPWVAVFGRAAVDVRAFPGDPPERRDVVEDFLRAVGAWSETDEIEVIPANPSLSGAGLLIADALNGLAPRGDDSRALQKYLGRIGGPKYLPDANLVARVLRQTAPDLAYLERDWGITFPDPVSAETEELFDRAAIESIAALLNDLAVGVETAGVKVRTQPARKQTFASGAAKSENGSQ